MFSKNALLFVATTVALASGSAKGMPGAANPELSLKITAAREIVELEPLTEENVRLDSGVMNAGAIGGCVALRKLDQGRVLEARDMICAGPTMGLRHTHLDPHTL